MKFNKTNKFIHLIGHTIMKITTLIMKLKTPYKHDTHNHVFPLTQQTCPITMNIKTISILNTSNKIKSNQTSSSLSHHSKVQLRLYSKLTRSSSVKITKVRRIPFFLSSFKFQSLQGK